MFHVISGNSRYGTIDQVPGLFYVATVFVHLNFIPLFPWATFLIREGDDKGTTCKGIRIPFSWKSVLFAYLRCFLAISGSIACLIMLIASIAFFAADKQQDRIDTGVAMGVSCLSSCILFAFLFTSLRITRAKPLRALELARIARISPEELAKYFAHHDMSAGMDVEPNRFD